MKFSCAPVMFGVNNHSPCCKGVEVDVSMDFPVFQVLTISSFPCWAINVQVYQKHISVYVLYMYMYFTLWAENYSTALCLLHSAKVNHRVWLPFPSVHWNLWVLELFYPSVCPWAPLSSQHGYDFAQSFYYSLSNSCDSCAMIWHRHTHCMCTHTHIHVHVICTYIARLITAFNFLYNPCSWLPSAILYNRAHSNL